MSNISLIYKNYCNKSILVFIRVIAKALFFKLFYGKAILAYPTTIIRNSKNIFTNDLLSIGLSNTGFVHKRDTTFLNLRGKLIIEGKYSVGRGCRIDIGTNATIKIAGGGYVNANTTFIIMHGLTIGKNCVISWNCQFLDDDFHDIDYVGKKKVTNAIEVGDNVWIGCGVKIYKGTKIPSGCVIAADSVVRGEFTQENILIAGNPAKVIKDNIVWK